MPHVDDARARVPADVEREDTVLAGLTIRQAAMLAAVGLLLWLVYLGVGSRVPIPAFLVFGGLILAATSAIVLGRRDGIPLDRYLIAALRQRLAPRRLVSAPDGVQPPPEWVTAPRGGLPAPLRLPAHAISDDGVIDLGADGHAVILACTTVNFALYTADEQDSVIEAFARALHALPSPAQFLVRAERVDLVPLIERLAEAAPTLPHPALEDAATEHRQFLTDLAARRDLLRRNVLLVLRQPATAATAPRNREGAAHALLRTADDAIHALAGCGITAHPLDGAAAAGTLTSCTDPHRQRTAELTTPDSVVTYASDAPDTSDDMEPLDESFSET